MEAATGAEDAEKETQPTYSVGDMIELNGQQYEVMAIVMDIATITEGVNSSIQDFLSFYLPADVFRMMYPDNTLRKLFFDVSEEYQPKTETMLIEYRNNVDKSLNFTSKSTLIEHYEEHTRANTVMGFAISFIIAFVGILNFVNSMVTAIVSRQKEFAMIQSVGMTKRQKIFSSSTDSYRVLAKSYRNTFDISDFAGKILSSASRGAYKIEPVIRHGEPIHFVESISMEEVTKRLARQFQRTDSDKSVMVLSVPETKGLEFDCVFLWKPDQQGDKENSKLAKLLYVAATRALHVLFVVQ